jgi:calcineurin-like phosphoesterase family protein
MNEIYISSDHHFNHQNILKYSAEQRKCESLDEMHEEMIKRHNSVVGVNDICYFLGDFCFSRKANVAKEYFERMNGKIRFIVGNHDPWIRDFDFSNFPKIEWAKQYYDFVPFKDMPPVVLFHFPIESWHRRSYSAFHLHGHCHGTLKSPGLRRKDVGIDCNHMYPFNLREVLESLSEIDASDNRYSSI